MTQLRNLTYLPSFALLLAACASEMGGSSSTMGNSLQASGSSSARSGSVTSGAASSGAASASSARPMAADQAYVSDAAMSDAYEIQSSQLALQRASSPAVKTFAQQMIDGHTATTRELMSVAQTASLTPPPGLDERRAGMLQMLQSAGATDFDKQYVDQQTAAHQEALTLHRTYATQGQNSELKAFAAKTAPIVEQHLGHVRELDTSSSQ